ncbi:MAG: DEAD/DEAH box helicase, partial [Stellaceae bacterium]
MSPLSLFHPAVAEWFAQTFAAPTAAQAEAWPAIASGKNVLIAAPTGSGKTLAAFLAAIDGLVRQGLAGALPDAVQIVYVSPLKALSNDIEKNLEAPLAGIRANLTARGLPDIAIRRWVRTGDTPPGERARMRRTPPHILVTTPESLYILLGSQSGRTMLAATRTVIIDEIHAVAPNKRGAHLALSLARLDALCGRPPLRIGLSATQKPIELVAQFLAGPEGACQIIDTGHRRRRDLAIELPGAPLEALMSAETWSEVYDRLAQLIAAHRTTLVFVNTRRMAERAARHLSERLSAKEVTAHHGSLAKEQRLQSEQRLKSGNLRALVATSSLELGIDIGEIDLVCQLGSPRAIASFLQRVGRSGHAVGGVSKGRLFPLSRDDLVECAALLDSVARGELDRLSIPEQPLDVLAQQITAEVAAQDWSEDELYALVRRAWPYRALPREDFAAIVRMLADGFSTRRGRRGALIHYDAINRILRGRRGARLLALTSGGTIPDTADYQVLLEPENLPIGTVTEDFAVESLPGDIFQLGNRSYQILKTERGILRVADAEGMPPTIPFWLGEMNGRSDELSAAVSRLRADVAKGLAADPSGQDARRRLVEDCGIGEAAAAQLVEYLAAAWAALGTLPTQQTLVFERFFDLTGGMHLVIHAPYGSRINRAWGLALRKRFCRKFNFELQAAATDDAIILSLTSAHSFPLIEVKDYLRAGSFRPILTQALIAAPMFATRWRWVAAVALALPRFRGGRKVPPQIARMEAEDLIAAVFPEQLACGDNIVGEREIPDHPLVNQTIADCLGEAMDADGLARLLIRLEAGEIEVVARDLAEPSPLAGEILTARPWAYLDDAPFEERRTQAVMARRFLSPEEASEIGRLDAQAIARVRGEAWPDPVNPDELHDALCWLGFLDENEVAAAPPEWREWLAALARDRRAARLAFECPSHPSFSLRKQGEREKTVWIAAERLLQFRALWPDARLDPAIAAPRDAGDVSPEEALIEILRGRLEGLGPVDAAMLAAPLGLDAREIAAPLIALESEGFVLRGHFSRAAGEEEWCERRLLARIHRYTVKRLRAEIEPVAARDFLRFLFTWQRVGPEARMAGPDAVAAITGQLEGFEAPAGAWETEILPARIAGYDPAWLDDHCLS